MKAKVRQWFVEGLRLRGLERARLGAFLLVPVLAACNDATGPTRFVNITPASQTVVLQSLPTGKVLRTSVTLTNTSHFSINWNYCGVTLEKKIEGPVALSTDGPTYPWFTVRTTICSALAAGSAAIAIFSSPLEPGQSVTIPIDVPVGQVGSLIFDGSPGEYRVHLYLTAKILDRDYRAIPHDLSVSDPFTLAAQ